MSNFVTSMHDFLRWFKMKNLRTDNLKIIFQFSNLRDYANTEMELQREAMEVGMTPFGGPASVVTRGELFGTKFEMVLERRR